jgi:hypothetical protein
MAQNYTTVSTMEAVKNETTARNALVKASAPATLLAEIEQGNARYCKGQGTHTGTTLLSRNDLYAGQAPKVMLLSGSDSRVPTEIIFDQVRFSRATLIPALSSTDPLTLARGRPRPSLARRASATSSSRATRATCGAAASAARSSSPSMCSASNSSS